MAVRAHKHRPRASGSHLVDHVSDRTWNAPTPGLSVVTPLYLLDTAPISQTNLDRLTDARVIQAFDRKGKRAQRQDRLGQIRTSFSRTAISALPHLCGE